MSRRLRLALALAALATTACSSFGVAIQGSRPDDTVKALRSLFVVVGSEKDLALPDPSADPLELVATSKQERYEAVLQFEPQKDAKGRLSWKQVLDRQKSDPPRVKVKKPVPLTIVLEDELIEDVSDTAALVLANFQDGKRTMRLVTHAQFVQTESLEFDLQGQEIKQR